MIIQDSSHEERADMKGIFQLDVEFAEARGPRAVIKCFCNMLIRNVWEDSGGANGDNPFSARGGDTVGSEDTADSMQGAQHMVQLVRLPSVA